MSTVHPASGDLCIPVPDVVRFIRQLSHDLRNHLNAVELQSAFLKEIATEPEVKEELQRLRAMLSEMNGALQRLTTSLATPQLTEMPYEASVFMEDWQAKQQREQPEQSAQIEWSIRAGDATLQIDPQALAQALLELTTNAFQHARGQGPIRIEAEAGEDFRIRIAEPKSDFTEPTERWGQEPFGKVKHGQYGLGLYRARNIIEAHRGRLEAHHDPAASTLFTTIVLPLADKQ